jgi:hypothetical protein
MNNIINSLDKNKINEKVAEVEDNMAYFNSVFEKVVDGYTRSLDEIMAEIDDEIVTKDYPSTDVLEKYLLKLSNCIYFISERAEKLGIYDALTKTAFKETYNNIYLENQSSNVGVVGGKKPTVAESTAIAENGSVYEATINDLYNRVYKTVKAKLDSANTMLSSISKLISRRMNEIQTQYVSPTTGRQILNEDRSNEWLPNQRL